MVIICLRLLGTERFIQDTALLRGSCFEKQRQIKLSRSKHLVAHFRGNYIGKYIMPIVPDNIYICSTRRKLVFVIFPQCKVRDCRRKISWYLKILGEIGIYIYGIARFALRRQLRFQL